MVDLRVGTKWSNDFWMYHNYKFGIIFHIWVWVDTHRPHHVFMKFCEFGSNENMTRKERNEDNFECWIWIKGFKS
jgi:hypothetical protein